MLLLTQQHVPETVNAVHAWHTHAVLSPKGHNPAIVDLIRTVYSSHLHILQPIRAIPRGSKARAQFDTDALVCQCGLVA